MLFQKKLNKIIEYGLYLLVFLLPIQTRWIVKAGESEYGTISLYGTDVLLIGILLLFAFFCFKTKKLEIRNWKSGFFNQISNFKFQIPKIWWLIAGLDLMVFISIFIAQDKLIAIYRYGLFLLGIGLFWLIVSASYNRVKLIYSLLAGIFLQACLGIWQFLTQSSFACKWLGMAEHNAGDLGVSVVETISSIDGIAERWLRAYGGMDHPNVLGGVLAVGLLIIIGLIIRHSDFKARKFQISGIYFLLLIFITSLFFTFSRGAWAGLLIGLLTMLFIAVIKKDLAVQKKLLEIILISGVLIFILFSQFQDLVMTRVSAGSRLEVKSNIERIESYKDSWGLIKNNWLFGVGIGNYVKYNANLNYANKNAFIQPVHNVFLLVWAEIGIIGFLFFISLLLCVPRYALCVMRYALLAAIFTMFIFDHWWWSLNFGVLFFWLTLGMLYKFNSQYHK